MPTARQMALFTATEHVVRGWPLAARIAFRDAVLAHPEAFCGEDWDPGEVLTSLHHFAERWENGLPWPPVVTSGVPTPDLDRDHLVRLERLIAAFGVELAAAITSREASRTP